MESTLSYITRCRLFPFFFQSNYDMNHALSKGALTHLQKVSISTPLHTFKMKGERLILTDFRNTSLSFIPNYVQFSTRLDLNTTEQQISSVFNPFLNKPWFLPVCSTNLLKAF